MKDRKTEKQKSEGKAGKIRNKREMVKEDGEQEGRTLEDGREMGRVK